jgi:hypothetical protein
VSVDVSIQHLIDRTGINGSLELPTTQKSPVMAVYREGKLTHGLEDTVGYHQCDRVPGEETCNTAHGLIHREQTHGDTVSVLGEAPPLLVGQESNEQPAGLIAQIDQPPDNPLCDRAMFSLQD